MNYCLHDPITPSPSGSLVLILSHCNVATQLWHKPFTLSSAELTVSVSLSLISITWTKLK